MRQFEHATLMDQAESLAISVSHALELVIKAKGWAVLAVSGGKSPVPMFERLRYRPIRWEAVTSAPCRPTIPTATGRWCAATCCAKGPAWPAGRR
jgi:hypothetical protein